MKFELYIIETLSGDKTRIYSPLIEGEVDTLYEKFLSENEKKYKAEITNIDLRLELIGKEVGLFGEFFNTGAGKLGQNLCTLRDRPASKLRLFFIEYGSAVIILGSGGPKPKSVRTTQEVPILNAQKDLLGLIAETLQKARQKGQFGLDENGLTSTTGFIYDTNDYE